MGTIERYMTHGAGDNPEASHKPKRAKRESKERAALRECVVALYSTLDQLRAIGIPDWHGAEGLSLADADAALAKAAALGVTP